MLLTSELISTEISPHLLFGHWGDEYFVLTTSGSVIASFDMWGVRAVATTDEAFHVITGNDFEYFVNGQRIDGRVLSQKSGGSQQFLVTVSLQDGSIAAASPLTNAVSDSDHAATLQVAGVSTWRSPSELLAWNLPMLAAIAVGVACVVALMVAGAFVLLNRAKRARRRCSTTAGVIEGVQ